jgi:hypothetical protein
LDAKSGHGFWTIGWRSLAVGFGGFGLSDYLRDGESRGRTSNPATRRRLTQSRQHRSRADRCPPCFLESDSRISGPCHQNLRQMGKKWCRGSQTSCRAAGRARRFLSSHMRTAYGLDEFDAMTFAPAPVTRCSPRRLPRGARVSFCQSWSSPALWQIEPQGSHGLHLSGAQQATMRCY